MRTIRKLSFLGVLSIGIAVLFLVGISFMQAQVTTRGKPEKSPGKPDKPSNEKVTWAVQIPEASWNLKGMYKDGAPYDYVNNGKDIIVSVEKKGWKTAGGGGSGIYYILLFKLVNPTDKYVEFSDVSLTASIQYEGSVCVFPEICSSTDPDCLHCFLNQRHPYSNSEDYDHVYIKFWIWGYDIESMDPDDTYQLGSGDWTSSSDRIRIKTGYTPVNTCFREEPAYHNILCEKYADELLNIWIERRDAKTWRIYVGQFNGDTVTLPVKETYCIEEKQKGWVSKTVPTLEATGDFSFKIDWIKLK